MIEKRVYCDTRSYGERVIVMNWIIISLVAAAAIMVLLVRLVIGYARMARVTRVVTIAALFGLMVPLVLGLHGLFVG